MKPFAMACAIVALAASIATAQCNPQPRLDQTNLNLGQLLSAPAPAPAATSAAASAGGGQAMYVPQNAPDPALVAAIVSALQSQGMASGGYKRLSMNSGGAASAAASAGGMGYVYEPPTQPAPSPVTPLAAAPVNTVQFALPANTASASSASTVAATPVCNSCGGRGFFRRANRTRTRAVSNVNGQRSVATSSSVSR